MFRFFLYSLFFSIAWRHYDSGQIPVFIEIALPLALLATVLDLTYARLRARLDLRHLRRPLDRRTRPVWLGILNQWLLLALVTIAYRIALPDAQTTEADYSAIMQRHIFCVLALGLVLMFRSKSADRVLNLLVLVAGTTLAYDLHRVPNAPIYALPTAPRGVRLSLTRTF